MRTPYVVVAWPEHQHQHRLRVRRHRGGRHRDGAPGTIRRPMALARRRRGQHRRPARPSALAARYSTLVVVAGTVAISGWFTASGAAALAQMLT